MTTTTTSESDTRQAVQSRKAIWLKRARQLHLYLGMLFAPSIIFFALTGALQLFGLHESHPGETYQAPEWIQKLASIHKDQTIAEKHGPPPGLNGGQRRPQEFGKADGSPRGEGRRNSPATSALKWFFLATAVGLVFTTALGIYMAFKFNRSRILNWSLLFVGTAVPVALIAMMA